MVSSRVGLQMLAVLVVLGLAMAAAAQAPRKAIGFEITVVHVSPSAGGVDPQARRFDKLLGAQLRYESLRVLQTTRRRVAVGGIESVKLPTGKRFRFRPMTADEAGVLVAVDIEDTAQGDFRIPKGKPLLFGGHPYRDGQLVVILEHTD